MWLRLRAAAGATGPRMKSYNWKAKPISPCRRFQPRQKSLKRVGATRYSAPCDESIDGQASGCCSSFYLRRCVACEGPIDRKREDQIFVAKPSAALL